MTFLNKKAISPMSGLPPYESFMSTLRNANVLEIEYTNWVECGRVGDPPKTGMQKFEDLLTVWQERGMTRLADFLEYYVNLDTGPFVEAAEKLKKTLLLYGGGCFQAVHFSAGSGTKTAF